MAQHDLTEDVYQGVSAPEDGPYSEAERIALRYATLFVEDHLAITQATFDELGQHFSADEIVELTLSMSLWLGMGRFTQVIGAVQSCPIQL